MSRLLTAWSLGQRLQAKCQFVRTLIFVLQSELALVVVLLLLWNDHKGIPEMDHLNS